MKKSILMALLFSSMSLFASITTVTTKDVEKLILTDKNLVIADARNEEYFSGVMIMGAIWLPYDTPDKEILAAIPAKDTPIVTYCLSDSCPMSQKLADHLDRLGYKNVYVYKAGLQAWLDAGLPTISE